MDTMEAIRETFFQECEEQLGELEAGLLAMEGGEADRETVNAVFRAVHSIKGGAGAFKLDQLVRFAHSFETALDLVRNQQISGTTEVLKTLLRAADLLTDLVKAAQANELVDETLMSPLLAQLIALGEDKGKSSTETSFTRIDTITSIDFQPIAVSLELPSPVQTPAKYETRSFSIKIRPFPDLYRKGNEVTRLMRELARIGSVVVRCNHGRVPTLPDLDPEGAYLDWEIGLSCDRSPLAVKEIFEFVEGDCDLDIRACPKNVEPNPDRTVRADIDNVAPAKQTPETTHHIDAVPPGIATLSDGWSRVLPSTGEQATIPSAVIKSEPIAASGAVATIRVDLDRVDRLINLVGELVINQAMLSQRVIEAGVARRSSVTAGLDELEQLTREIQESVMAIRAQPVKPLFQRMTRIVREIADATGKLVRLRIEGEATEVDRTVVERLADPLTHLIRNAVDHGLEQPDVRLSAGKPRMGEVKLSAAHRSGRIAIEISDDGAGIDRLRVKEIAIRKGLIAPDAQLTDTEIDNLLFVPGFSTAERVSDISGRGVGMDVVKRSIQSLGGRISITSRPRFGTTFSLSLPLTLAVLDGMIVKVGDQTLVVPLTAIIETLKAKASDVYSLGPQGRVLSNRGSFIPLIDIGRDMGYRINCADPLTGVVLLVETEAGKRSALMIDAIQDQRQVVIKSLETNYGPVSGVAAATILGDGRIALILDVDAVVNKSSSGSLEQPTLIAVAG